jgi:putative transposase
MTVQTDVVRRFNYRLYPSEDQSKFILNSCGISRNVYNVLLGKIIEGAFGFTDAGLGIIPKKFELVNYVTELKSQYPYWNEINSQSIQVAVIQLRTAFDRFFAKQGGFPKFKSKRTHTGSFGNPQNCKIESNHLKIPRLKEPIKMVNHREIPDGAKVGEVTITKSSSNQFYASVVVSYLRETEVDTNFEHNKVGIDLGIKTKAVLSDGTSYIGRTIDIKHIERKLGKAQKNLSKKIKRSKNYEKQRVKVAKLHDKIKNIRKDENHKITRTIASKNSFVAIETLKLTNMMKNRRLARAIARQGLRDFIQKLEYKVAESQGICTKIGQYVPSSKACSACGNIKTSLSLSVRMYECSECGSKMDRDLNASKNILKCAEIGQELPDSKPVNQDEVSLLRSKIPLEAGSSAL